MSIRTQKLGQWFWFMGALAVLLMALAIPAYAQDDVEDPYLFEFTGVLSFGENGGIMIGGVYVLAPAGTFNPPMFQEGDEITITGYLLNDDTIQVTGIMIVLEDPEVTPEPEMTPEPEATPSVDEEDDCVASEEDGEESVDGEEETLCYDPIGDHPIATVIATEFELDYDEVSGWHDDGYGFGEIARALLLVQELQEAAEANGETLDEDFDIYSIFALREEGNGWGQILANYDIHPSDLAPGRIFSNRPENAGRPEDAGNNGNGGGNGNANGNGNGNAGGNGNGNGGGRGGGRGNGG